MDAQRGGPAGGNGEARNIRAKLEDNGFRIADQRLAGLLGYVGWWCGTTQDDRKAIGDRGADVAMIALRDRWGNNPHRLDLETLAVAILAAEYDLCSADPKFGAGKGTAGPWAIKPSDLSGHANTILHKLGVIQ